LETNSREVLVKGNLVCLHSNRESLSFLVVSEWVAFIPDDDALARESGKVPTLEEVFCWTTHDSYFQ